MRNETTTTTATHGERSNRIRARERSNRASRRAAMRARGFIRAGYLPTLADRADARAARIDDRIDRSTAAHAIALRAFYGRTMGLYAGPLDAGVARIGDSAFEPAGRMVTADDVAG